MHLEKEKTQTFIADPTSKKISQTAINPQREYTNINPRSTLEGYIPGTTHMEAHYHGPQIESPPMASPVERSDQITHHPPFLAPMHIYSQPHHIQDSDAQSDSVSTETHTEEKTTLNHFQRADSMISSHFQDRTRIRTPSSYTSNTSDTGLSVTTLSTLPPSYRTNRSFVELPPYFSRRSLPSPNDESSLPQVPPVPPLAPSAYRGHVRGGSRHA